MAKRVPASVRTRESLSDPIEGRLSSAAGRGELVKLATLLTVEKRRRLKIIPIAFGEKAVLTRMFGVMIRAAERWRSIRPSELERRQMRAASEEINQEYKVQNSLGTKTSAPARQAEISSTPRT